MYVTVSMLCGQNGVWAFNQLSEQKRYISSRTSEIQNLNDELNLEKTAIQNDKDVIAAYARKLDYVFDNEKLVKIKGLPFAKSVNYDTGTVLKSQSVLFVPEWICKTSGLCVGGLLFFIILLNDIVNMPKKRSYEVIEGIPIYDVPQI